MDAAVALHDSIIRKTMYKNYGHEASVINLSAPLFFGMQSKTLQVLLADGALKNLLSRQGLIPDDA